MEINQAVVENLNANSSTVEFYISKDFCRLVKNPLRSDVGLNTDKEHMLVYK